jgi:zinc transport system permease protein
MLEFFQDLPRYTFLQHAVLAAVLASIPCGIIGSLIVVRRSTYIAGAISHCLLGGMGLAYYLHTVHGFDTLSPLHGAIAAAILAAVIIGAVGSSKKQRMDTVLSAVWSIGMALGIAFIMATPGYTQDLMSYLFGNILMVSRNDLLLMSALNGVIIIAVLLFYSKLLVISFHRELAELRGIRVHIHEMIFLILSALTVVLLVHVVGIVMAIALLTLPAATAGYFFNRLSLMMIAAAAFSLLFTTGGLVLSYSPEWPAGPTIIIISGVFYLAASVTARFVVKRVSRKQQ